jgi:hypothetical protein
MGLWFFLYLSLLGSKTRGKERIKIMHRSLCHVRLAAAGQLMMHTRTVAQGV